MLFLEHVPDFVDGVKPSRFEFETLDQLLQSETVSRWRLTYGDGFHRFSMDNKTLMAEFDDGRRWWVVGFIVGDHSSLGLPKWEARR